MVRRWRWVAGGAAGFLLVHTLLWVAGHRVLATQTARWIAQAQSQGWSVSTGAQSGGGWPVAAVLVAERVAVEGGERFVPGGLTWSADRVVLSLSLFHPLTLSVSAEGQQFLRLSHLPDLDFTAARARARIPLLAAHDGQAGFEAAGIAGGIAGSRHPQDVQLATLSLRIRQERRTDAPSLTDLRLLLHATGIGLPDIGRWPLGATVAAAGASLRLSSPTLPAGPAGEARARAQAVAWRDGGGRLEVRDAVLRWGPLWLAGSADLGLDAALQPAGGGTLDATGTAPALDALAQDGLVTPGLAATAEAVLAVMPRAPDSQATRLAFRLRDDTVSVGGIPLAHMQPIAWDRGGP
jgi:hypothetical protein